MRGSSTAAPARSRLAGTSQRLSGPAGRAAAATETSPHQAVIGGGVQVALAAQGDCRVALRIEVDEQRLGACRGGAGGDVDGGRRLADAALLVGCDSQ